MAVISASTALVVPQGTTVASEVVPSTTQGVLGISKATSILQRPSGDSNFRWGIRCDDGATRTLANFSQDGNAAGNPEATKQHGIFLEGGDTRIENVDVSDNTHGGIYIYDGSRADLYRITGSGNGFGAVTHTGSDCSVRIRDSQFDHLNHEIESGGADETGGAGDLVVDSCELTDLGVLCKNPGETVVIRDVSVVNRFVLEVRDGAVSLRNVTAPIGGSSKSLLYYPRMCSLNAVVADVRTLFQVSGTMTGIRDTNQQLVCLSNMDNVSANPTQILEFFGSGQVNVATGCNVQLLLYANAGYSGITVRYKGEEYTYTTTTTWRSADYD